VEIIGKKGLVFMQRVLIDARESGTSTGRYIDKLIENLAKLNTDLDFSIITKPHRQEYIRTIAPNFGIEITEYKEFTFGEQLGFKKQIESIGADLVHFGMVQQPIQFKGKVVTTIHDLTGVRFKNPAKNPITYKAKQRVYKHVIKKAAKKSVYVISASEYVKQDLVKYTGLDSKKFVVTYESADYIKDTSEEILSLSNKQFIMYIGRPTPHKNLWRLIEAFVLLKKDHPDLILVLAGKLDFNYKQIKDRINANKIDGVVFTDFVSEGQLKWLYQHCVAYVFPSLSEGFGLPGLEAMIHGAPVVSSNATCLPEIYGDAAIYFDPKDIKDIANNIDKLLVDDKLRDEMKSKGLEQAKKYSWATMAKETLEIYQRAL
jgi:glycosyltransferase involved in cell wall biosynthesis